MSPIGGGCVLNEGQRIGQWSPGLDRLIGWCFSWWGVCGNVPVSTGQLLLGRLCLGTYPTGGVGTYPTGGVGTYPTGGVESSFGVDGIYPTGSVTHPTGGVGTDPTGGVGTNPKGGVGTDPTSRVGPSWGVDEAARQRSLTEQVAVSVVP